MLRVVQTSARVDWLGERITGPHRFNVSISRANGSTETYERVGGSSIDRWQEAFDRAGDGAIVRIVRVKPAEAA